MDLARECGLILDDWQQFSLDALLLEQPNGQWAAPEGAVVVARQNGKNVIEEAGEIAGLLLFGEQLITHSAHLFNTCAEHFLNMKWRFENVRLLADLVDDIHVSNGKEEIILRGGARLKFIARSRGGGRGFTGDRVVFDEAFSLGAAELGALIPALSARSMEVPGPQAWYFSSPPHSDSTALHSVIRRARAKAPRLAVLAWLNEPGTDRHDLEAIYRVNPGMGIRISEEWIDTERDALADFGDEFDRERNGIPSPEDAAATVFGAGKWQACADQKSSIAGTPAIALDVAPEMVFASFAAAGRRADGLVHFELIDRRPGTAWVVRRAKELARKHEVPLALDPKSPTGGLIADLEAAGVPLVKMGAGDMPRACATLQNEVVNGTARHLGQQPLDAAAAGAAVRVSGDTWIWARKSASADITPLVAATVALWAAEDGGPSVYEERSMTVLG